MIRSPATAAGRGLRALADRYTVLLCDIWGVVHNGVQASPRAVDALSRFREAGGTVALITNAPRPASSIAAQLVALAVPRTAYDVIITSGDVTNDLITTRGLQHIFHLGPDRDLPLFEDLDVERVSPDRAQAVLCTGLYDDETESPADYRDLLADLVRRGLSLYCANPDRVVQRGDDLVYCAGALAELYGELGGTVVLAGKPHSPIYQRALHDIARARREQPDKAGILAIGDSIATDIQGAASFGLDALLVTGGIHAAEMAGALGGKPDLPDRLKTMSGLTLSAVMAELAW